MPSYYLSYIEIESHSALMISEQLKPNGPARIIAEVGFGHTRLNSKIRNFSPGTGGVREETNASRILYGKVKSRHKTFEISQAEIKKFFAFVERDRKLNRTVINRRVFGGPRYEYLTYNCKTYALSLLKEMGILESLSLKNFLIQIPGLRNAQLKKIPQTALLCPLKDEFLSNLNHSIPSIHASIQQLYTLKNINNNENAKIPHQGFFELLARGRYLTQHIHSHQHKAGFCPDFNAKFQELQNVLSEIGTYVEQAEFRSLNRDQQVKLIAATTDLGQLRLQLTRLNPSLTSLHQKYTDFSLEFYWKTTPPMAKRTTLKNFTALEKLIYAKKLQTKEIHNGIEQVMMLINQKLEHPEEIDPRYARDLVALRKLLDQAKQKVRDTQLELFQIPNKMDEHTTIHTLVAQEENIKQTLASLKADIANHPIHSPHNTNPIIGFINRVLRFFNINHLGLGFSAKDYLKYKVSSLAKRNARYCKTTNLFPSRPGEGVLALPPSRPLGAVFQNNRQGR